MEAGRLWRLIDVLSCVALYMTVGPCLILVNKAILDTYGFPYPMLVSGLGQASSAVGATIVVKVLEWQPLSEQAKAMTWVFYRKNMVVVGAAFASSLCFGNAGYIYLTVSFVQILKAFTPCVVVAGLYLANVEKPTLRVALSVLGMSLGTVFASLGEAHFVLKGFIIMCFAETSEATRLVLTQRLLCNLRFGAFEGLYLMAPVCTAWMWGLAMFIEVPRLLERGDQRVLAERWYVFLGAAVLGFAVNVASFLVIKRTSSVMVKILGTARNAGLVLLSALVMGEEVTAQQAAGYALCLGFFGAYNYYKMTEKHVPVSHAKEEIMPLKADVEVGK
mmetsp:Transcript_15323/g.47460  ORF Transcript_15323/g.47460 Transcript_15323/m.47460 type:complete len:333 (+) Transcript_15323:304-1302(+)